MTYCWCGVGQRSFKIECVEVKSRKEAHVAQTLADTIIEQLQVTKQVLESRFFSDPPRIDAELQMARLTSLLHYYADRAATHKLIDPTKLDEIHRYIDRVEEKGERAEISMTGWVISLDGAQGFKKQYGDIPLRVLTAHDLGQIGLSTRARLEPLPEPDDAADAGHADAVSLSRCPCRRCSTPRTRREDAEERSSLRPRRREGDDGGKRTPSDVHDAEDPRTRPRRSHRPTRSVSPQTPTPVAGPRHRRRSRRVRRSTTTKEVVVTLGNDPGGSPVRWRVSTKGSPHAFVIGIPGQGKSVTTRKVIRDFEQQGLPSLVFDFHGDMAADPPAGAVVLDAALGPAVQPVRTGRRTQPANQQHGLGDRRDHRLRCEARRDPAHSRVRRAEEGVRRHRVGGQHSRGPPPDDARVRHRLGRGREGGGRQERCRATTHVHRLRTVPRGR